MSMLVDDTKLVEAYQAGAEDAWTLLVSSYEPMIHALLRSYYLRPTDREDLAQEARIGLWQAARQYDPHHNRAFHSWARTVIRRRIADGLKSLYRQKHRVLSQALSLDSQDLWARSDLAPDIADQVCGHDDRHEILRTFILTLTPLERVALWARWHDIPLSRVASRTRWTVKQLDNGYQRVRRKAQTTLR